MMASSFFEEVLDALVDLDVGWKHTRTGDAEITFPGSTQPGEEGPDRIFIVTEKGTMAVIQRGYEEIVRVVLDADRAPEDVASDLDRELRDWVAPLQAPAVPRTPSSGASDADVKAAIRRVVAWVSSLADLPPPGPKDKDDVGFSGVTNSPLRTYLAQVQTLGPDQLPIDVHFAAVSYLREHSRTQLNREEWEKAFAVLKRAWTAKLGGIDRKYGTSATAGAQSTGTTPTGSEDATAVAAEAKKTRESASPEEQAARVLLRVTGNATKGTAGKDGTWAYSGDEWVTLQPARRRDQSLSTATLVGAGFRNREDYRWVPAPGDKLFLQVHVSAVARFADFMRRNWPLLSGAMLAYLPAWEEASGVTTAPAQTGTTTEAAPWTGTAQAGQTKSGLRWEWKPESPDTYELLIPKGLSDELKGVGITARFAPREINGRKVWWISYLTEELDRMVSRLREVGAGALADVLAHFQPTWTQGPQVSDEDARRAANLGRRFRYMMHPDVRANEEAVEEALGKVAGLLRKIKPGDTAVNLGAYGAWEVVDGDGALLDGAAPDKDARVRFYTPYTIKGWDAKDELRFAKRRQGAKGWYTEVPIKRVPETARRLDLFSPALALSLRIALLTEVLRECPELEELAGAGALADIADPAVRQQAEALVQGAYQGLNPGWKLRPYQEVGVAFALLSGVRCLIGDGMGLGKAQPLDAKVLTPTGWRTMGELAVGDPVIDPDGGVGYVEGVYPQGVKDVYRLTTCDGGVAECCDEHLWLVQTPKDRHAGRPGRVLPLAEFKDRLVTINNRNERQRNYFLPMAQPVEFQAQEPLRVDPYLLGVLLGDGGLSEGSPSLSNPDEYVVQRVRQALPSGVSLKLEEEGRCDYRLTQAEGRDTSWNANPLTAILRELGVYGHLSIEKFVPDVCQRASVQERRQLLAGLLDTDGDCTKDGAVAFNTSSERLRDGVLELIRSLGGFASVYEKRPTYTYKGERRYGNTAWRLHIRMPFNPFELPRKADRWKPSALARGIDSVELARRAECQCIRVSTKRQLYITDGYLTTHNTPTALAVLASNPAVYTPALVISPASVTYNWKFEGERWAKDLNFRVMDSSTNLKHLGQGDVLVLSWGSVSNLFERIKQAGFETLVIDESHYGKNPTAARTKSVISLAQGIPHRMLLSGTAMENRPEELWSQLHIVAPEVFTSSKEFKTRFGSTTKRRVGDVEFFDDRGADGPDLVLAELRETLRCFMVRRLKSEVLHELPEKTRSYLWGPLPTAFQNKYEQIAENMEAWLCSLWFAKALKQAVDLVHKGMTPAEAAKEVNAQAKDISAAAKMAIVVLGHLRRLVGEAKAEVAVDWLESHFSQSDEPVVVFVEHQKPLKILQEGLDKLGITWTYIDGSVPPAQRAKRVAEFQNGDYQVFLGTRAMAEGVTLTRATDVLFVERWWVPSKEEQAEDRTHRLGQPNAVIVRYLMATDTVDSHIHELVDAKRVLIQAVLRGETIEENDRTAESRGDGSKSLVVQMLNRMLIDAGNCWITPQNVQDALRGHYPAIVPAPKVSGDSDEIESDDEPDREEYSIEDDYENLRARFLLDHPQWEAAFDSHRSAILAMMRKLREER